jgi:hypothetical protein
MFMSLIAILFTLFGPLLGEIIKRIFLKIFPKLSKAERKEARKEFRAIAKRAIRKDKNAECGYSAVCSVNDVQSELEAFEAKLMAKVAVA